MQVYVRQLTGIDDVREAISFAYKRDSKQGLATAYQREHSIIRCIEFEVRLEDIPSKTSVHFVRHSAVGQFHLVGSNRGDWHPEGGVSIEEWDQMINRSTPVNHYMRVNAQHLIDMSRKRLCTQSEKSTRDVMWAIREAMIAVDPDLAQYMVPNCWYRGGICPEEKSCGLWKDCRNYNGMVRHLKEHNE